MFFIFLPTQRERSELHKTKHLIPSLQWVWLVSMWVSNEEWWLWPLQTGTLEPSHTHPRRTVTSNASPTGRKHYIRQSMQLHLTEAIHNADIELYRSTFICHNPTVWISCQRNMYVVPMQPNQQWSSGDKVCNIPQQRERNQEVYMDFGLRHVSCSGTYWSNWWLVTLAKLWLQMNKEPDRVSSGRGRTASCSRQQTCRSKSERRQASSQAAMISPRVSSRGKKTGLSLTIRL